MHRHAFIRAAAAALLMTGILGSSASAATTVEVERTSGINLDTLAFGVTATCGFTVELHSVGKEVLITRYQDGRLVSEMRQIVYHGVLLNPANGRTVPTKVAGPGKLVYYADGTIVETTSGVTHRNVPGDGLVSGFIGHSRVVLAPTGEVDGDGFPIYDVVEESSAGPFLGNAGVCEHLA